MGVCGGHWRLVRGEARLVASTDWGGRGVREGGGRRLWGRRLLWLESERLVPVHVVAFGAPVVGVLELRLMPARLEAP